jgi:hypothetical protein
MMVGSKDKAVELLKSVVEVPSYLSKGWLRVDPTFDPLRSHPGVPGADRGHHVGPRRSCQQVGYLLAMLLFQMSR